MTHLTYPNESAEYRRARNAMLEDESLCENSEGVAAHRRSLPPQCAHGVAGSMIPLRPMTSEGRRTLVPKLDD